MNTNGSHVSPVLAVFEEGMVRLLRPSPVFVRLLLLKYIVEIIFPQIEMKFNYETFLFYSTITIKTITFTP